MRFSVLSTTLTLALTQMAAFAAPSGGNNAPTLAPEDSNTNGTTHTLERRFDNARMTWFNPGLGACGAFNSGADSIVALNGAQWDAGTHCFQTVTLSVNGIPATAVITDLCPSCPFGGLDLSPGLFSRFASLDVGVLAGSWNFA
ncbi:hypothetical protein CVT24_008856 [Panaeolus cyanescens]|uniref:RlpA-like protein double-psi beta-barrel domain-containing protein n=1 Tax=Panaeolus cyanescens TaxID=181874 RepID=A0A409VAU6_9AGAR|nr:hypothetical protein CVT24_008856 [Panaeolus cyanescens]